MLSIHFQNLKLKLFSIEDEKDEKNCIFCLFFLLSSFSYPIEHNFSFKFEKLIDNIKLEDIMY